jgi:hypothetical protein
MADSTKVVLTLELRSVQGGIRTFDYVLVGPGTAPSDLAAQYAAGSQQTLFLQGTFAEPSPQSVTVTNFSVIRTTEPCPLTL